MIRKRALVLCALVLQVGLIQAASAALIVDTGTPVLPPFPSGVTIGGPAPPGQSVAGEFTTTQAYDITGLSAFVGIFLGGEPISVTENFHLGLATETFTTLLSLPVSFTATTRNDGIPATGWASTSVPSYLLPAGTYWIVASATVDDFPLGLAMPGFAPNPLTHYAFMNESSNGWQNLLAPDGSSSPALGFQVEGDPVSAVPLPGALGLLLSGISALSVLRRRRTVATNN
jgi:hypothetical protein